MHHLALNRPGTNERHLHDQIVKTARLEPWQRVHLRATLDLKQSHCVGGAHHVVHRLVGHVELTKVDVHAARMADVEQAILHDGEHAESKQIDFDESDWIEIVFLPLNDRAFRHRRRLNRHHGAEGFCGEHKPTNVDRAVPRQLMQSVDDIGQHTDSRILGVEASPREHLVATRVRADWALGDAVACRRGWIAMHASRGIRRQRCHRAVIHHLCPRRVTLADQRPRTTLRIGTAIRLVRGLRLRAITRREPLPCRRCTRRNFSRFHPHHSGLRRCLRSSNYLLPKPGRARSPVPRARSIPNHPQCRCRALRTEPITQHAQHIRLFHRKPQHPRRITHRTPSTPRDLFAHHRRVLTPIPLVHVLQHTLPIAMRKINVNIRRFCPFLTQKSFEQQLHANRIHRRNAETKADRRVGGGPASLTKNSLPTREPDNIPDNQEETRQPEFRDHLQFMRELRIMLG